MKPFGVDISSYQGRSIDYTLMKQNTKFVAVRAGISWGYEDPVFAQSWRALKGHNRIAYHVLYPSQDVTRQVDWFFDILSRAGFDPKTDRLAIDIELWQGQTPQRVTEATTQMYDQITERTGRKPIVYSGAWFTNSRMVITEKLKQADWWLATYPPKSSAPGTEHPGPPLLPRGVTNWLIHQTSETGIGRNFGLPSGAIDTNRWNGTLEDVQAYFGLTEQEPEPPVDPPVDPPTQPKAYKATVTANVLNVRKAPHDIVVGSLKYGAEVEVLDERDAWRKLGHQLWVSGEYLKRIANAPELPIGVIDLILYSQNDPRWKNKLLGTSNTTIGNYGCLVTCIASVLTKMGYKVDPAQLVDLITARVGWHNGNQYYWKSPLVLFGDVHVTEFIDCYNVPAPLGRLDAILQSGRPATVHVDYKPETPANDQHWVNIIGKKGASDYWIHDPIDGALAAFSERYRSPAQQIFRIVGYSRK